MKRALATFRQVVQQDPQRPTMSRTEHVLENRLRCIETIDYQMHDQLGENSQFPSRLSGGLCRELGHGDLGDQEIEVWDQLQLGEMTPRGETLPAGQSLN